ncbi:hypothetical protein D3H35_18665 [Cohnella faecalis]|uniref:Uncharacterized protein n=2 Tax=Cohnella faecalis TaxID=2315694 RepID=A0A398CUL9_9BACL|nr:hypothetical protein D3H35_18665 [Cohnella faecalis]
MRITAISAYEYQRVYGVSSVERSARPYAAFPFRENDPLREERSPSGRAGKRTGARSKRGDCSPIGRERQPAKPPTS